MWRQRGTLLVAALLTCAAMAYVLVGGPANPSTSVAPAASSSTSAISPTADCANTVMAAIENAASVTTQQAYQCMSTTVQQAMTETAFGQQLASLRVPNATRITRLGTYQGTAGNTLVYFAVDANNQSTGYVVYVGPDGRVLQVQ